MRDLSELNINDGGVQVSRQAPSQAVIRSFEAKYGVRLPREYLTLLRHSNGGHPELDTYGGPGLGMSRACSIDHFYFLTDDAVSPESIWSAAEAWRGVLGALRVPFAEDGGGNPFVFDFSTDPPSVWIHRTEEGNAGQRLASTFGEFVDGLVMNPESI